MGPRAAPKVRTKPANLETPRANASCGIRSDRNRRAKTEGVTERPAAGHFRHEASGFTVHQRAERAQGATGNMEGWVSFSPLLGVVGLVFALGLYVGVVRRSTGTDRMREIAREGYSGAPDLAIKLIRDRGYGGRRAHRICCNFVRLARDRGIKPYDTTGELLDEAARACDEPEPHLTTEDVQDAMGLERFFEKHCNVGDPCPSETLRMIGLRRQALDAARARQAERKARIERANEQLDAEIQAILG